MVSYLPGWGLLSEGLSHGAWWVATYYFDSVQMILVSRKVEDVYLFMDGNYVVKLGPWNDWLTVNTKSQYPYYWKRECPRPEIPEIYDE